MQLRYEPCGIRRLDTRSSKRFLPSGAITVAVLVSLATGGCSDAKSSGAAKKTMKAQEGVAGPAATPTGSAREAVRALLSAERDLDHEASFLLLSSLGRQTYQGPADWARRRSELPAITGFTVEDGGGPAGVTALVEHAPGLDPFVGLSPARERQTWTARQEGGRWLLDPDPEVVPLLPPPAAASEPAIAWAMAMQACDQAGAQRLQAVENLHGVTDAPDALCRSAGSVSAASPGPLPVGPASQDLVAQYGTEVLEWAAAVAITGPGRPFQVVLAPIGDSWKVLGTFE